MYSVCLNIIGKTCVVIGGGAVAQRKVIGILRSGGEARVISPELTDELKTLADQHQIEWVARTYVEGDLEEAFLVFAATDQPEVQEQVCREADERKILLNQVDAPQSCGFHVPATVHCGDITVAVSTNGRSPAVSALLRGHLEKMIGPEFSLLLEVAATARSRLLAEGGSDHLLHGLVDETLLDLIREKNLDAVRERLARSFGGECPRELVTLLEEHR